MTELIFNKGNGLLPAIAQDHETGRVLMLAYINEESWEKTLETGQAHYWSRSRGELWHKGGTSGNVQIVREIFVDCDNDTVLFRVEQVEKRPATRATKAAFSEKYLQTGKLPL